MQSDKGSIDFVQVVVSLIIIVIAVIASANMLIHGYRASDYEIRYKKALCVVRSEIEYIQGRIDSDPEMLNLDKKKIVILDNIKCEVTSEPLEAVDAPETGIGIDYYIIKSTVHWVEPNGQDCRITLQGAMSAL